jgi:hypothetical protein
MKPGISEIRKQMEVLAAMIEEYLGSGEEERIVIPKERFSEIKFITEHFEGYYFEYQSGIFFRFIKSTWNRYEFSLYNQMMKGTLERLILVKSKAPEYSYGVYLNYEVEPYEATRLAELYSSE